jgi:hypothetical protein
MVYFMSLFKKSWAAGIALMALPGFAGADVQFFNPENGVPGTGLLSQTGIYSTLNATTKTPDTAMKYFEVNAALWSDGAHKARWIILPPGTHVTYVDSADYFDYPDGAIFVKNFYLDSVGSDTTTRKYWETRLLVNKEDPQGNDAWYGFSYKWNKAGDNASYAGFEGLDTAMNYYPKGLAQGMSYRKWSFPGRNACLRCHRTGTTTENGHSFMARGVLGFFPAQLKRPASGRPAIHQIDSLFKVGVFTGTPPTDSMKRIRFKSIGDFIPAGDPDLRFRTIDTIARSYIAGNCSGCHGTRNITVSGSAPYEFNYDFHRLKPVIEFGSRITGNLQVEFLAADTTNIRAVVEDGGRSKYLLAVRASGLPMSPGSVWDMGIPSSPPTPTLITPGYPALSMALYRQFALRRTPWRDSISYRITLDNYDPNNRKSWIFVNPWGSAAWRNDLATHETGGVKIGDVLESGPDQDQMPPLATHLPDTAAMKILGEWAKNYRTLYPIEGQPIIVQVRGRPMQARVEGARIQNRFLIVPAAWTGRASMSSLQGRVYALSPAGRGRYLIPASAPSGLYFFKVGSRSFRASVLR